MSAGADADFSQFEGVDFWSGTFFLVSPCFMLMLNLLHSDNDTGVFGSAILVVPSSKKS